MRELSSFRLSRRTGRILIASTVAIASIGGVVAIARQAADANKGKAQVVERRGPEVDVRANGRGSVVVLFPQAAGGNSQPNGAGGEVEVVLVESQVPAPAAAGGEGQQQQPQNASPTGREIVFSSRDASDGIVRYSLDPAGNGRKYMILARVDGKYVEARQSGGSEGVTVFTVAEPQKQEPQQQQPQPQQQPQASGQADGANGGQANGQAGGQPNAQQNQPPAGPPAPPAQAAVILLYTGGSAS